MSPQIQLSDPHGRLGGLGDAVAGPVEAEVLRSDALSRVMALSFSSYPRMVKQLETP